MASPSSRTRLWFAIAGFSGATAVAVDAYARHGLDSQAAAYAIDLIHTATRYQGFHALALLVIALITEVAATSRGRRPVVIAGWAFVLGQLLFCGGLYARAAGLLPPALGFFVPLGGLSFISGWLAVAAAGVMWRSEAA